MTERDAFLAAIAAAPDDDLPKLVFADWLDERNDPEAFAQREALVLRRVLASPEDDGPRLEYAAVCEQYANCAGEGEFSDGRKDRAEFIRASLRLEELRWTPDKCGRPTVRIPEWVGDGVCNTVGYCGDSGEVSQLITTTNTLAGRWYEKWFADCAFIGRHRRGWIDTVTVRLAHWCGGLCPSCNGRGVFWSGGWDAQYASIVSPEEMVECGPCNHTGWMLALGPQLVRRQPITTVRVNLTPLVERFDSSFLAHWTDIPADVHRHLGANEWGGKTAGEAAENARSGLSTALIAWAKEAS